VISKADILERAREWQLTPEVVEKDYVLGWLLAGIAQHPATKSNWVFKGGTCLKKCVLETYRFSEDLDFTLLPSAEYSDAGVDAVLREIVARVTTLSGIRFPASGLSVKSRKDLAGRRTLEARIEYSGPLVFPGSPKIRLDLTQHEPVLRSPERRAVFHPYPDHLPSELAVTTYAIGELVAEKTRALCERMRPRDLYDVVLLGAITRSDDDAQALRAIAIEKFAVKGMLLPVVADVMRRAEADEELRSEWDSMLGHQLPATPLLDDFLARLPEGIAWMREPPAASAVRVPAAAPRAPRPLSPVPAKHGESLVIERGIRTWGVAAPLEAIRFAGASHLLVEFRYHDAIRRIEPYSLRRPKTGNLLLYGFEQLKNGSSTNEIRAYKVAEMDQVRILNTAFTPRYAIELTEQSGVWRW
jgi:predicted nucleotidyltransferase component of viral defense system